MNLSARAIFISLLVFVTPFVAQAQDVTVASSPDWDQMPKSEADAIGQQAVQHGGRLVDASRQGVGGATAMSLPMKTGVTRHNADSFVAGLITGVKRTGGKFISQSPTKVQSLDGQLLTFAGQANGHEVSMLTYVLFTNHEVYTFNLSGKKGMTRSDPMVTSYLSRIRLSPSVVPGDVNAQGEDEGDRLAFRIGLAAGAIVVLLFFVIRSVRRKPSILPPPLP